MCFYRKLPIKFKFFSFYLCVYDATLKKRCWTKWKKVFDPLNAIWKFVCPNLNWYSKWPKIRQILGSNTVPLIQFLIQNLFLHKKSFHMNHSIVKKYFSIQSNVNFKANSRSLLILIRISNILPKWINKPTI